MKTLIYYGNENLQKYPFVVNFDGSRSAVGRSVQRLPIARGDGSSVVNTRTEEKEITISGTLSVDAQNAEYDNIQDLVQNYTKVFADNDPHFLRIVPEYLSVVPTTSTAGWTVGRDTKTLAYDGDNYQLDGGSVKFDIDITTSTYTTPQMLWTGTAVDITGKTDWNLEFWVYIPDAYYVWTFDCYYGSDVSNHYYMRFQTNYENKKLKNGWNLLSVPLSEMTVIGTVNTTAMDFFVVYPQLNPLYSSMDGILFSGIMLVNEDRVRNYECYRQGPLEIEGNYYNNEFVRFSARFLNFTGYGQGTHNINLNTTTGITANTTVINFETDGSFLPRPELSLTLITATGLSQIQFKNLGNNQSINILPSTVAANDVVNFGGLNYQTIKNGSVIDFSGVIPEFELGNNKLQLYVSGLSDISTPSSLQAIVAGQEYCAPAPVPVSGAILANFSGQQFTSTSTYPITSVRVNARLNNVWMSNFTADTYWYIFSDNADSPNVALTTFTIPMEDIIGGSALQEYIVTGINLPVSSGTKYWLVSEAHDKNTTGYESLVYWGTTTTSTTYAGLSKSTSTTLTGGWVNTLTKDFQFQIIQSPSPAWNLDLSVNYKKLYS